MQSSFAFPKCSEAIPPVSVEEQFLKPDCKCILLIKRACSGISFYSLSFIPASFVYLMKHETLLFQKKQTSKLTRKDFFSMHFSNLEARARSTGAQTKKDCQSPFSIHFVENPLCCTIINLNQAYKINNYNGFS